MMKLVAFCAVACGCVAPMLQLWRAGVVQGGSASGLIAVGIFEAVVVPLAWSGLALLILRRGGRRDVLVLASLLCSASVAQGFAGWVLFAYTIPAYGVSYGTRPSTLALNVAAIVALLGSALFLSYRLWCTHKTRCPA